MTAARAITATAIASFLTVFAVIGMARVIEVWWLPMQPSPIAVSRDRLDFGLVPLNGSVSRELVVRNDIGGPLHARFLVGGGAYTVAPQELILHPGVESSITIVASADGPGKMDAVLSIYFEEAGFPPVLIRLAARARNEPPPRTERV